MASTYGAAIGSSVASTLTAHGRNDATIDSGTRDPVHRHLRRETTPFRAAETVVYRRTNGKVIANIGTNDCESAVGWLTWGAFASGVVVKWSDGTVSRVRERRELSRRPN